MQKFFCLLSLVFFVLLLNMPAIAQSNLSVQELKDQYNFYNKIANDPDIFWVVSLDESIQNTNLKYSRLDRGKFVNRDQFEAFIMRKLMLEGKNTLQDKVRVTASHINLSQKIKADLRSNLLYDLEFEIRERGSQVDSNNSEYQPSDSSSSGSSFGDVVKNISSDEYLATLTIDNVLPPSNGGGIAIADSQTSSYDGNWNEAINDNYSSCPKTKPDDRSSFKAYSNGQTSGSTYRYCAYFGNGYLKLEEPYVNGKKDGLQTVYTWSNKYNFSYTSTRTNYSNGKRDGLMEFYTVAKNGAVYRMRLTTYSDGLRHGDSVQWYDNGQTMKETNFFQDKTTLQYNYNKDGSFSYCTKWDNDRTIRDCKTGKKRR